MLLEKTCTSGELFRAGGDAGSTKMVPGDLWKGKDYQDILGMFTGRLLSDPRNRFNNYGKNNNKWFHSS